MSMACPMCQGTGKVAGTTVPAEVTQRRGVPRSVIRGGTCRCDGPPHRWDPSWCPSSGAV
jgi:hypothetical protein